VRWVTGRRNLDWKGLEVLEQQIPGMPQILLEDEAKGLPDLWIHGDGDWSLIIESKVAAKISEDQLKRHRRTAQRNGFVVIDLVVLLTLPPAEARERLPHRTESAIKAARCLAPAVPSRKSDGIRYLTWPEVYCWMRKQAKKSSWARCMANYLEVAEVKMTAKGCVGEGAPGECD